MSDMLQWYERDGYYKKRLLREIKFIQEYRSKVPESFIEYLFCGKTLVENTYLNIGQKIHHKVYLSISLS